MGRKKKENSEGDLAEAKKSKSAIHGDAKRSIVAIFLFVLAILLVMGFLGEAGILGKYLNKSSSFTFGSAKWVLAPVLVMAGIILLFRKETLFYVSKLAGLFSSLLGIMAIAHIILGGDKMEKLASKGEGGGYLGYFIALAFTKLAGKTGGLVILFAILIIGAIFAFNFSFAGFIQRLINIFRRDDPEAGKGIDSNEDQKMSLVEDGFEDIEADKPILQVKSKDESNNIKNVQFVEDPIGIAEEREPAAPQLQLKRAKSPKKDFSIYNLDQKWQSLPTSILDATNEKAVGGDIERKAEVIKSTLQHFGIEVELGEIKTGPTVTQYSFKPAVGVKLSRITELNSNLALALAQHPIRIEAPIPGKPFVGIEVPNKTTAKVRLREMLESEAFHARSSNLNIALGKDVGGNYIFADLAKMPHLLIAGSTGTGKSVCVNTILLSLFYQNSPRDLQVVLVDPKRVELSGYNKIPYLAAGHCVIVDNSKVINALKGMVMEMERRYRLLQDLRSKDIASYNSKVKEGQKRTYNHPETGEIIEEDIKKLPYIIVVIDELADLMASHGKLVEGAIIRLAQMARAVGIHLVVSTQRPDVNVLTGLIKSNIGTRIAFRVPTQIDSRTILDTGGADKLLGNGDMLYKSADAPKPKRIQGAFVSEDEIKTVVKEILKQGEYYEADDSLNDITEPHNNEGLDFNYVGGDEGDDTALFERAKNLVIESGKASTSFLQRRLKLGYPKAARLMDDLEEKGIISPSDGTNKQREILMRRPAGPGDAPAAPEYEDPIEDQAARDKWQI